MLIGRLRKMFHLCKVFPKIDLVASTNSECFSSWRSRAISSFSNTKRAIASACASADSHTATEISYVARDEAQDALFDYLYCTRGLPHEDAEHISMNSPTFLQYLMSRVEKEQYLRQSLSRYLRYHPINEFEPFFESLGLKASEFAPLLPRELMFLSDDIEMLQSFHVLCNYGVPRSKIGKICVEAGETFRYNSELLRSKLLSFENMGLSKPSVIKLVTSCPKFLIGGVDKDFVRLQEKLKTLGIELNWVLGYLDEENTYHWKRIIGTLEFFSNMGFSDVDLAKVMKNHPRFFFDNSGNQIYVIFALLLKSGLSMSDVLGLLACHPIALAGKFAKNLWEAVHFLYEIGMEAEEVGRLVKSHTQVLGSYTLIKPKSALEKLNVTRKMIRDMIREDPNELRCLALGNKSKRILIVNVNTLYLQEKTSFLLKLGFVEDSEEMMRALKVFRGRGDQLQERFECLMDAGLDYHDAAAMVRRAPSLLNQSRDVIGKKISYLTQSLGQSLESIISFPAFLCFDSRKICLRLKMYEWLKEKGIASAGFALSTLIASSEKRFVKLVVSAHPKGFQKWEELKMLSSHASEN